MQSKEDIINSLLSDIPSDVTIEVNLPSECKAYNMNDSDILQLRPMTFEDERSLIGSTEGDPLNLLLEKCFTGVKVLDLLPMDKLYLIMKLREISYGDDYETLLICKHCSAENPTKVKLSKLNVNPVPDDFQDPISVFLPKIKKEIKVKMPRVRDESVDMFENLWRFVVEIDGHTDKSIIAPVVDKLPLVDIKTIVKALTTDYGLDTNVKLQCKKCGGVSVIDLPIDANFFGVS
jgi:hypothetical protein